jgi:hypothetical protein
MLAREGILSVRRFLLFLLLLSLSSCVGLDDPGSRSVRNVRVDKSYRRVPREPYELHYNYPGYNYPDNSQGGRDGR